MPGRRNGASDTTTSIISASKSTQPTAGPTIPGAEAPGVSPMGEGTFEPAGRIFISYRREETGYAAGWLYDRLTDRFGEDQVFKDVDSIELGDDFVEVLNRAVGSCDVLLALIGDRWSTIKDEKGQRRLDDPDDFVRLEVEAALTRNVRVIPILVDEARMPTANELPKSLVRLVRRQALELSPSRFESDTNRLLKVLDSALAEVRTANGSPAHDVMPTVGATPSTTTGEPSRPTEPFQHGPASDDQARGSAPEAALTETMPPAARSTRTRILIAAAVSVALVLLVALIVTRSGTSSSSNRDTVAGGPTAASASGIDVDSTPVDSGDGVRLTGLTAVSRNYPARIGDTVTVNYSLTNVGTQPIPLDYTFVGARNAAHENRDTEDMNEGKTLEPGETISATGRVFLDRAGRWDVWPCYALTNGNYCPDKWQVFSVLAS